MSRKASREIAMKLVYQIEIQKGDIEWQVNDALENKNLTDVDKQYIRTVVFGVLTILTG